MPLTYNIHYRYFMGDCFKHFRDQGRTETEAWNMCQKNLNTVDTIEGFWQVFNHIERPSRINLGCDYCFFKASAATDIGFVLSSYITERNRTGLG